MDRFVRTTLREAGRRYERARRDYEDARGSVFADEARIVCRRYAEKRTVELDENERPDCYDAGHPDCEGCVEDLDDGTIETW
ncbi:DUF7091 family protein [Halalkalicoccus jeotgali]|uniref:Uncharacterized protein n=1 Tax=Halalkalicoccus jeotgali (strain DSM 18796 / CECT 7217 / JCM 14584 / KCTC 4019 / B3) TaxID=795797 RepID=D8J5U8_HALJB|nr:hypothetical protein HacjB3_01805 [Halalkalicoccus jeotgali B3]ELY34200.1 hypothetical protein C497_17512 [Halalkalicoccus jeotgali B3]